ncbi:MAG: helix-turn-helix domain-containing protein [Planctomycetota bacterium]
MVAISFHERFAAAEGRQWLRDEPQLDALRVCAAGHFERRPHHRIFTRSRLFDVLMLCTEGRGWLSVEGRRHAVGRHDLVWARGASPHGYGSETERPYSIVWCSLQGSDKDRLLAKCGLSADRPIVRLADGARIAREWRRLVDCLVAMPGLPAIVHTSASMVEIFCRLGLERSQPGKQEDPLVLGILELMEQHLDGELSLADIAAACGRSIQYCCRRFNAAIGDSPASYFMRRKIQCAQSLLADGQDVASIAEQLGFCDRYHFSKVFKRITGVPPGRYRKGLPV